MADFEDYYEILQVSPSAEPEIIEAAYKRLAQKYHPDINKSPLAAEKMRKINIAHDFLGDLIKRRNYDTSRPQHRGHETNSPDKRGPAKPQPIVKPSRIRFSNMECDQRKTSSFVIDNIGGPYSSLYVSRPNSWLKVIRQRSFTDLKELPIEVEIEATGLDWGADCTELIYINMDNVQTSVTAEIHMKSGTRVDWDKEIIDRTIEIATDPDAWAYLHRGNAYVYKGEYDKAIEDFTKAIEFDPTFTWAYHERGSAYDLKGEDSKAISDLNKAIEIDQYGDAFFARGHFYSKKGDYDKAIADFTRAIEMSPTYAIAYQMRAKAYRNKGENNRAEADFIRAKELGWSP